MRNEKLVRNFLVFMPKSNDMMKLIESLSSSEKDKTDIACRNININEKG